MGSHGARARRTRELRAALEALLSTFDAAAHLPQDPVSLVRAYRAPRDREVAGLVAAALAYGRVAGIRRSASDALARLSPSPAAFVVAASAGALRKATAGFRHRFHDGRHLACLLSFAGAILRRYGSIGRFLSGGPRAGSDIEPALTALSDAFRRHDPRPFLPRVSEQDERARRFLVPSPASGGACKRMCLLFRWMVRRDDGVDFGLWRFLRPSQLVVPFDTHLARIARALALTRRRSSGWATAREVTRSLARLDPDDPLRYDFPLCHIGVTGATGLLRVPSGTAAPGLRLARRLERIAARSNRRARGLGVPRGLDPKM